MRWIRLLGIVSWLVPAAVLGAAPAAAAARLGPSADSRPAAMRTVRSIEVRSHRSADSSRWFHRRSRVGIIISGGSYWGCPGPWGCAYGAPYGYYPPPDEAIIDTDVSPEKARISLDGEDIGTADDFDGFPDYLDLEPGRHVLEFRAPGFRPLRITINARRGRFYSIDRRLRPVDGDGSEAGDEAVVGPPLKPDEIGGRPDRDRGRDDEPDQADRDQRDSRGDRDQREAAEEDGEGLDGDAESGERDIATRLIMRLRPLDAAVYVDGKLLGAGESIQDPGGAVIEPGRHVLDIVRPGYEPYRTTIIMREGERKSLAVRLTPLKE